MAHRRLHKRLLEEYKQKQNGKLPLAGSQQIYIDGAYVSPQYIACASIANSLHEPFELGLQQDDMENVTAFRFFKTLVLKDEITGLPTLIVDKNNSDPDGYTLFKDFRFPIAAQKLRKKDIWDWYKANGYEEVRKRTITCQQPIVHENGTWEPCGMCTSCVGEINEKVTEPFTKAGLARYHDYIENHTKEPERFRMRGF